MNRPSPIVIPASAVMIDQRALLIEGPPGSGKSSLALALIDRGAVLIGDDAVSLSGTGDQLLASPPPNIGGLLEVRGVGIGNLPVSGPAPVALILALGSVVADRLPDALPRRTIAGVAIPVLEFDPGHIAPAIRAEWALRMHGLAIKSASLSDLSRPDMPT